MDNELNIQVVLEITKTDHRKLDFHRHQVTGRQIKETAKLPLETELAVRRAGELDRVENDETLTIKDGERFIVVHPPIKVEVHYIAASKPFKTEAEPSTTVGQIKTETLKAFGLTEDARKVYKLYHRKTELSNLNETVGQIAGHEKELDLKLEEVLVQGA